MNLDATPQRKKQKLDLIPLSYINRKAININDDDDPNVINLADSDSESKDNDRSQRKPIMASKTVSYLQSDYGKNPQTLKQNIDLLKSYIDKYLMEVEKDKKVQQGLLFNRAYYISLYTLISVLISDILKYNELNTKQKSIMSNLKTNIPLHHVLSTEDDILELRYLLGQFDTYSLANFPSSNNTYVL